MKIFFDTTKLEKLRNGFLIFDIGMILLTLFTSKMIGNEEKAVLVEIIRGNVYLFADNRNLVIMLPVFYLIIILVCTLQVITLQAWIRTVEDAQRHYEKEEEK